MGEILEKNIHRIFIVRISRIEGDPLVFTKLKNGFMLTYCSSIIKGLPDWARKLEKEDAKKLELEKKENTSYYIFFFFIYLSSNFICIVCVEIGNLLQSVFFFFFLISFYFFIFVILSTKQSNLHCLRLYVYPKFVAVCFTRFCLFFFFLFYNKYLCLLWCFL